MVVSLTRIGLLATISLIVSALRPTASLLCYSSYFKEKYEQCDGKDYCFFLEDYKIQDPTVVGNQSRSCERRGYCKMLIENLTGKVLTKYGLVHKCGTFMANEDTYTDLCCCNFDWCNKLEINEPPVPQDKTDDEVTENKHTKVDEAPVPQDIKDDKAACHEKMESHQTAKETTNDKTAHSLHSDL